jgi:hypothetical protein
MSERAPDVILGPIFTAGVVLLVYGVRKRARRAAVLGALAIGANFLPAAQRLQMPVARRLQKSPGRDPNSPAP